MDSLIRPAGYVISVQQKFVKPPCLFGRQTWHTRKRRKKEEQILYKTERKEEGINKRRKRERNLKCMASSTACSDAWYLFTEVSETVTLSWPTRRTPRRYTIRSFGIAQSVQISVQTGRQGFDSWQDAYLSSPLPARIQGPPCLLYSVYYRRFFPHW